MGVSGVWWAIALSSVISALLAYVWFLRGTWKDNVVDSPRMAAADD
jgi:Na+-driven multidrug efflux pump